MASEQRMTPQQHAEHIAQLMREAANEAEADTERVNDPKAQALFETVREVLNGGIKALEDYAEQREAVWRS
jgi:hypothetical protein